MTEVWIVNASPVITMAKAGYLQLFHQLAVDVVIPEAVAREIQQAPSVDPARKILESGWGGRASPNEIPPTIVEWGLVRNWRIRRIGSCRRKTGLYRCHR